MLLTFHDKFSWIKPVRTAALCAITSSRRPRAVKLEALTFQEEKGKLCNMSVHEIIAELPKLSEQERDLVLRRLVNLDTPFEPTPAMEDAIQEGLRSLREEKTYSAAEVRARIAAWTAG
jgi:hypothetical protein